MSIKAYAEKEMKRMDQIFSEIKLVSNNSKAKEFFDFAHNYYQDGIHFFKEEKYEESFEAFIISWAYLDISLKLNFLKISENIKKYFTS